MLTLNVARDTHRSSSHCANPVLVLQAVSSLRHDILKVEGRSPEIFTWAVEDATKRQLNFLDGCPFARPQRISGNLCPHRPSIKTSYYHQDNSVECQHTRLNRRVLIGCKDKSISYAPVPEHSAAPKEGSARVDAVAQTRRERRDWSALGGH